MGQVGLCTPFLTAGLPPPREGRRGLNVAGRRHEHQRERHYPERRREPRTFQHLCGQLQMFTDPQPQL